MVITTMQAILRSIVNALKSLLEQQMKLIQLRQR